MTDLPLAQTVRKTGDWTTASDSVTLDYAARFLRRKRLMTDKGAPFLVDLDQTTSLEEGDALELHDGRFIAVHAAPEKVLVVRGASLPRLAWHIGNRHTPCQIAEDHLLIQEDRVIAHMLDHLGATVTQDIRPFTPEGGAYGHGRTHSHEHGHSAHSHAH